MVSTRSRTSSGSSPAAELPQKRAATRDASTRPAKKTTTPKAKAASDLAVGKPVTKQATLKNQNGDDVVVADTFREQGVVFFMYPRANTPGCTKQACGEWLSLLAERLRAICSR
jgi:peroxiredoxin Q/BCP